MCNEGNSVFNFILKSILLIGSWGWQVLLDVLTLDLPSVIVKFVEISENCRGICESIITHMCEYCSPREMMFALSEVYFAMESVCLYFFSLIEI